MEAKVSLLFVEALAVAKVLGAIERSWETERWEEVQAS